MQQTINERLKLLIESLDISARAFSRKLDVSESTTRNYLDKTTKPSTDYIERIAIHFKSVNVAWLITGNGEPFLSPTDENNQAITGNQKFFRSPVVATGQGPAHQENNATPAAADVESLKNKLALVEQENQHLKAQLAMKDALLTSKEETLALLRISFNRPN